MECLSGLRIAAVVLLPWAVEKSVAFDAEQFSERHHLKFAAAFCRGRLGLDADTPALEAIERGLLAELRLQKFKRSSVLPRVSRVLGMLKGLAPSDLLDVGTGRGTFLWPLLDEFPELPVAVLDLNERRVRDLEATRAGGVTRLTVHCGDVCATELEPGHADVVTALEVLEHISSPAVAAQQLVRLARRAVIVSVPSKADDNPEHLHLFDRESLAALFRDAGAEKVSVEFVLNHMVALVRVGS